MNLEETTDRAWTEKRDQERARGMSAFRDLEQKLQPMLATEKACPVEGEESNRAFFQNEMKQCFKDGSGLDQSPLEGQTRTET